MIHQKPGKPTPANAQYGSIRVYEWGPLSGDKVLLVHGISTSCITLTKLANGLVRDKGCRVMLFDLFGRGFSDNPADLPHDARLYTTQVLMALASSPDLAWTGPGALRLIGYSLGGGIAVHFATAFPHLVSSLVLLAPSGLIRPESLGPMARAAFALDMIPARLLTWLTARRLRRPIRASGKRRRKLPAASSTTTTTTTSTTSDLLAAALPETTTRTTDDSSSSSSSDGDGDSENNTPRARTLEQRVLRQVQQQLAQHAGFVAAFMSCIRHAPLMGQEAAWARLAARAPGTTAIILGAADELIDPEAYARDALPLAGGAANVRWRLVPGGHDFPMSFARETLAEIYAAWGW
ncbi:alpha/beta-hydrolase [Trichocladium antarcticum]|uniref:Alpha/beta-hydrolase n=1 Tax=Trichocladium antarcticum TaxID=1450529 RepID=A0AAN6UPE9_9PEZI|nr:alpha/beta-hydrolase [Trichocladium antarcticum]